MNHKNESSTDRFRREMAQRRVRKKRLGKALWILGVLIAIAVLGTLAFITVFANA